MNILKTKNYDQFKFLECNREVRHNYALERSMLSRNMLESHPIVVNKNMYIIDGQHRLLIAKKHRLDVYYVIDTLAEVENIVQVSSGHRSWSLHDYLNYYCKQGRKDYLLFKEMCEKHGLNPAQVVHVLGFGKHPSAAFRHGVLSFQVDIQTLEKLCLYVSECYAEIRLRLDLPSLTANTLEALFLVCRQQGYDHAMFLRKIKLYPGDVENAIMFRKYVVIAEKLMNNVYNKATKSPYRLGAMDVA